MLPGGADSASSGQRPNIFQQVSSVFWVPWLMGPNQPRNRPSLLFDRRSRRRLCTAHHHLALQLSMPPTIHHLPISNLPLLASSLLPALPLSYITSSDFLSGAPYLTPSVLPGAPPPATHHAHAPPCPLSSTRLSVSPIPPRLQISLHLACQSFLQLSSTRQSAHIFSDFLPR